MRHAIDTRMLYAAVSSFVIPVLSAACTISHAPCPTEEKDSGPEQSVDGSVVVDGGNNGGSPGVEHRVFVTSARYLGDFGGADGANAHCTNLAHAAGIPGTFKAILSDPGGDARERIAIAGSVYMFEKGNVKTLIAADESEFWSGRLRAPISWDENSTEVAPGPVWTGTHPTGVLIGACHCDYWTRASVDAGTDTCAYVDTNGGWHTAGFAGHTSARDGQWSASSWNGNKSTLDCNTMARLYCIQQ